MPGPRDSAVQHRGGLDPRVRPRRLPRQRLRGLARLAAWYGHARRRGRLVGGDPARPAGGGDRAVRLRLRDQHDPGLDDRGDAAPLHPDGGPQGHAAPRRHPAPRRAQRDDQSDHGDHAADQLSDRRRGRGRNGVRLSGLRPHDARGRALQGHRAGRGRRARGGLRGRRHEHPRRPRLHGPRSPHPRLSHDRSSHGRGAVRLAAGYHRRWIDLVLTRACDIVLSFPVIILYMIILTTFGSSAWNIVGVLTLTKAPIIARIVRGMTLELREREYVAAAKMRGESALYIMLVEILPNARGPLIVDMCLRTGYNIIIIGVLGFLGIGLPPPDPDWGGMVKDTYGMMSVWPHMALVPCAAISSLVIGFNLLAVGLRELGLRD